MRFAKAAKELTALDLNLSMIEHLKKRVDGAGLRNVEIIARDFLEHRDERTYDWAIALGVSEYQADPSEFLDKLLSFSHKWVLATFPTHGVWGKFYRAASKFSNTRINLFTRKELVGRFGQSIVHLEDAGLKTRYAAE